MCQNVLIVWHNSTELFEYLSRRNLKISLQRSWYRRVKKMPTGFYRSPCLPGTYWAHIEMSEFKNGFFYLRQTAVSSRWLVHSPLALSPESCTCLPLFGSNSANWPRSELQFCENPVRLSNELCSFTSAPPVSDYVFSVSLFSARIPAEVCSLSWGLYRTVNSALCNKLSVPVQPNCGTAGRTGNWVLCGGSSVVAGRYQPQLWRWRCRCVSSVQRCACRCCSLNMNFEMRQQSSGTELPLMVESYGFLNDIFPFLSILDARYPVFNLHLANALFDVILPPVLGSSLWSFD